MILEKRKYGAFDLIRLAFKVAPMLAAIMLLMRLIAALTPAILVIVTANFIDISVAVLNGDALPAQMRLPILLLGGLTSFGWFLTVFDKYLRSKFLIATRLTYRVELIEKRARLQYRYIEDQDTYDLIKRIATPADTQIIDQYQNSTRLLDVIIQVVSLLGILLVNIWWAAIALLVFAIPIFYVGAKAGKTIYAVDRDVSKTERKAYYLTEVCSGREPALERTLFAYGPKMTDELWHRFEVARIQKQKIRRKIETKMTLSGMLVSLTVATVAIILLQPVATGVISLGLFVSIVMACLSLSTILIGLLPNQLANFAQHLEYLKELEKFCHLEETADALATRCNQGFDFKKLELKNVCFTYPGTEKAILNNVNLTILPSKHYAFVGVNGAGKTTIIKLLTGQYQDYEGEILINGQELKAYSAARLKTIFSVAYQDFAKYEISVKENMLVGNLDATSDEEIAEAIRLLELDEMVDKLPKGLATMLGKIAADGVDISGGQWQRIALARSIINQAPIKILDEPTAALDPISESNLYAQFEKIIADKTSIFISHRLGSIKLADEIFVFDEGSVVENGDHETLMAKKGVYAKMYESQLEWYQNPSCEVQENG